jgi:ADP-heptose:LPS heptosyltransferase
MKLKLPGIKKIAVFRALHFGDMLCAVPAFRALRHAYPDAEITLIGLSWAGAFTHRFTRYFNRFIYFPGFPGLQEQPYVEEAWNIFLPRIWQEKFDLLLQMHNDGTIVNSMLQHFNVRHLAGFHNKTSFVHSELFLEYPEYGPEVKKHLLLMNYLGIADQGTHLEFPLTKNDYEERDDLLLPITRNKYVCIHPGSGKSRYQWAPSHFALLADYCNERGYIAVLTGTDREKEMIQEVRKSLRQPAFDLTGFTSLGCLGILIKDARLIVSSCTGIAHLAAAVQTPGIIINMDGRPERWQHDIHTVIDWTRQPSLGKVLMHTNNLIEAHTVAN